MPATFTEVLPERKASKHSAMEWTPNDSGEFAPVAGVLVVHTERATVKYAVAELPSHGAGRVFGLAKLTEGTDAESEAYTVFCSKRSQDADACTCKGWSYKHTCKHRDAARALLANGWI
jgi:hypothetical protein